MAVATLTFADRLAAEVERKRSQLVVGLDPNPDSVEVLIVGIQSQAQTVGLQVEIRRLDESLPSTED